MNGSRAKKVIPAFAQHVNRHGGTFQSKTIGSTGLFYVIHRGLGRPY